MLGGREYDGLSGILWGDERKETNSISRSSAVLSVHKRMEPIEEAFHLISSNGSISLISDF